LDEVRNRPHYGFNDGYVGFFADLQSEILEIIDIPNIDSITKEERSLVRIELENQKFDPDRYMENFYFQDDVNELLRYKAFWEDAIEKKKQLKEQMAVDNVAPLETPLETNVETLETAETNTETQAETLTTKEFNPSNLEEFGELTNETEFQADSELPDDIINQINATLSKKIDIVGQAPSDTKSNTTTKDYDQLNKLKKVVSFTDEERDTMKNLPNKEYLVQNNEKSLLLGLVDIMFAYAYNVRSNYGDDNIESAWTICKVSPTLAGLETFRSLKTVLAACFRRSLAYPLYRSWSLSERVLNDVRLIFQLGKRCLLKCLLAVRKSLEGHEYKYYLNRLVIDDYCVWLQYASKKRLRSLKKKLNYFTIAKSDVEWPLEAYEKLVQEEGMVFEDVDQ
ncbi:hypothetical protein SAMD00019534_031810, partial [Acytostelium subglobosum LB1]|uniref:hypothetical protein n=1 Tax=Acytostelium subglobosum LB1 TaxID=1410327 RepID=UPI000644AE81